MIDSQAIRTLSKRTGLRVELLEKDYVMNLILDAITHCHSSRDKMFIKGGAAIYKCYNYQKPLSKAFPKKTPPILLTTRFTNDLDLTVTHDLMNEEKLKQTFSEIGAYLYERHGLEIDQFSFPIHENQKQEVDHHYKKNCRGYIHFKGPMFSPKFNSPVLKLDLTADEKVAFQPYHRVLSHPYAQGANEENLIATTYSLRDVFAEKIRALFERISANDLYDCIHLMNHPQMNEMRRLGIGVAIMDKFSAKNLPCKTDKDTFMNRTGSDGLPVNIKDAYQQQWEDCLSRLIIDIPPFEKAWEQLDSLLAFTNTSLTLAKKAIAKWQASHPNMDIRNLIDEQMQKDRYAQNKEEEAVITTCLSKRKSELILSEKTR